MFDEQESEITQKFKTACKFVGGAEEDSGIVDVCKFSIRDAPAEIRKYKDSVEIRYNNQLTTISVRDIEIKEEEKVIIFKGETGRVMMGKLREGFVDVEVH